MYPKRGPNN